tara:strand:+ start:485 stop:898 length:414 start_codon:yes stop_codon:yes gene_type:complete
MSTLQLFERTPFDILVRNFFQDASAYAPIDTQKLPHPVDVYEADSGLGIDIACTGIDKEDLDIQIQGNIIRVNYDKSKLEDDTNYYHRGIAKRSFNLGWKIDSKYDLSKADANFENGLLKIYIPFAKGSELKSLKIK